SDNSFKPMPLRGTAKFKRCAPGYPVTSSGIVELESPYSFTETVQRLLDAFAEKNVKVFATIDQQAEARAVGLSMPPTTLIIFGNPKAGTPLMLANSQAGVDLPLKVLVCEPVPGATVVMFTTASELVQRHSLAPELASNILPAEHLIKGVLGQGA
ncbi:MAG: DUF302 domain-containing protein, partial [Rhodanobacteraceae bacterium]